MLISIRNISCDVLRAGLGRRVFRGPSFLVRLMHLRGVTNEDRLFPSRIRSVVPAWPILTVALEGNGIVRSATRAAVGTADGEGIWAPTAATYDARNETAALRALIVQWDPAIFGGAPDSSFTTERFTTRDFARLEGAAERLVLAGYDVGAASIGVAALFDALAALGFVGCRPAPGDLVTRFPASVVRVGVAIDHGLSDLRERPMALDLEHMAGQSPAQLRRLTSRYAAALRLQGSASFRDLRNVWRLHVGATLMTAAGASTERVAKLLGYGSAAAFCHAFANAGMPSPGEVKRVIGMLR